MSRIVNCMALWMAILCFPTLGRTAEDVLFADFEGDNYGDWKATGTALGERPARGTWPG